MFVYAFTSQLSYQISSLDSEKMLVILTIREMSRKHKKVNKMFQIVKFRSDALLGEIKMHSSLEGSIVKHEQGNLITHLETLKLKIHR